MCGTYSENPQLLPTSKTDQTTVDQKYERVEGGANGHYKQWVEAAIAGYGKKEVSSPFSVAGPLTETLLIANLAIRGFDMQKKREDGGIDYPGRYIEMLWDSDNMRVTNFEEANQFVKRNYREGWTL